MKPRDEAATGMAAEGAAGDERAQAKRHKAR